MQTKISQIQKIAPTILVDGVFFQISDSGIARVWRSLFQEWVKTGFAKNLILLDRDGTAPQIPGINSQLIHRYEWDRAAEDSFQLQEICDQYQADLFISTYYTTPISTPGVLLIHDMIPETIGANLTRPIWQEKHYAICYAAQFITVSKNTARDLYHFYPQVDPAKITVALNGVDPQFTPSLATEILQFRITHQIIQPYFIIVGDRVGLNGYKNAIHTFRALAQLPDLERFEILCVGGNPHLETELADLIGDIKVHQLALNDRNLQAAYSGAIALIYPSIYEGFGLPILEAMACGCPVITCRNSALPEVAGSAAIYVRETDVTELVAALNLVQQPDMRSQLIAAGLAQAKHFSWTKMAETIEQVLIHTYIDIQSGKIQPSPQLSWAQFRQTQLKLDATQSKLAATQAQLIAAQAQITSMKNTKFWQLREVWWRIKQAIQHKI